MASWKSGVDPVSSHAAGLATRGPSGPDPVMRTLRDAHDAYYAALDGIWERDPAPMAALWSRSDDVTLFGSCGQSRSGRDDVLAYFGDLVRRRVTGSIRDRDTYLCELGDVGYSVCVEEGYNIIQGIRQPVLRRSTSVFRREQGGWHLIHHHDDVAAAPLPTGGRAG